MEVVPDSAGIPAWFDVPLASRVALKPRVLGAPAARVRALWHRVERRAGFLWPFPLAYPLLGTVALVLTAAWWAAGRDIGSTAATSSVDGSGRQDTLAWLLAGGYVTFHGALTCYMMAATVAFYWP